MNQAVPSVVVARSFIAMMPGMRSFQPAIFDVSSGCSRPASRHFTTLCEQGWARSALKPARIFSKASSSSPKKVKVGDVAVLLGIVRMEARAPRSRPSRTRSGPCPRRSPTIGRGSRQRAGKPRMIASASASVLLIAPFPFLVVSRRHSYAARPRAKKCFGNSRRPGIRSQACQARFRGSRPRFPSSAAATSLRAWRRSASAVACGSIVVAAGALQRRGRDR